MRYFLALFFGVMFLVSNLLYAEEGKGTYGRPDSWQLGYQNPVTPAFREIISYNFILLVLCAFIVLFVAGLLLFVIFRFNEKSNPVPSKFSHKPILEVIWVIIPAIIVSVMGVYAYGLNWTHFNIPDGTYKVAGKVIPAPEITVKIYGNQWYWSYEYAGNDISFSSNMAEKQEDINSGSKVKWQRLLSVDNMLVLPVNTTIRFDVTSRDVLHSFAVPSLGVKIDAVPGRLNETWTFIEREGKYYGQCSELCGVGHYRMPIAVKVVSKELFSKWLKLAKEDIYEASKVL